MATKPHISAKLCGRVDSSVDVVHVTPQQSYAFPDSRLSYS